MKINAKKGSLKGDKVRFKEQFTNVAIQIQVRRLHFFAHPVVPALSMVVGSYWLHKYRPASWGPEGGVDIGDFYIVT